jgi:hypothetical protein
MHGGRKHGMEICGVKSRRPRHTRGCSDKEEEEEEIPQIRLRYLDSNMSSTSFTNPPT